MVGNFPLDAVLLLSFRSMGQITLLRMVSVTATGAGFVVGDGVGVGGRG